MRVGPEPEPSKEVQRRWKRDALAESILLAMVRSGLSCDRPYRERVDSSAVHAFDLADAFLNERDRRSEEERTA